MKPVISAPLTSTSSSRRPVKTKAFNVLRYGSMNLLPRNGLLFRDVQAAMLFVAVTD
ncbi:MAG: hypothetical protein GY768_26715 [Planctomycetaceae bacterium]|nr:hypothetical protein [Planctomycetaceae bacterium]